MRRQGAGNAARNQRAHNFDIRMSNEVMQVIPQQLRKRFSRSIMQTSILDRSRGVGTSHGQRRLASQRNRQRIGVVLRFDGFVCFAVICENGHSPGPVFAHEPEEFGMVFRIIQDEMQVLCTVQLLGSLLQPELARIAFFYRLGLAIDQVPGIGVILIVQIRVEDIDLVRTRVLQVCDNVM